MINIYKHKTHWMLALMALALVLPAVVSSSGSANAQTGSRTFPQTGKTISGLFLQYWDNHGSVAQQGYPISAQMPEKSDTDGKTYTVQYFERAVFEMHPENPAPNNVLLSLLGNFLYKQKYPSGAPNQTARAVNPTKFSQTGKTLGGKFRAYWEAHGGLAQQGYPISNEFQERSDLNGKTYTVQYFERAVFELHPENAGTPYEVLLSQLGTFRYKARYGGGAPPQSGGQVSVDIIALAYTPQTITIKVGDTVTWTQHDKAEHTVTSNTGVFKSPLLNTIGQTFSYTFTKAGAYDYHCEVHPFMLGKVIVNP